MSIKKITLILTLTALASACAHRVELGTLPSTSESFTKRAEAYRSLRPKKIETSESIEKFIKEMDEREKMKETLRGKPISATSIGFSFRGPYRDYLALENGQRVWLIEDLDKLLGPKTAISISVDRKNDILRSRLEAYRASLALGAGGLVLGASAYKLTGNENLGWGIGITGLASSLVGLWITRALGWDATAESNKAMRAYDVALQKRLALCLSPQREPIECMDELDAKIED